MNIHLIIDIHEEHVEIFPYQLYFIANSCKSCLELLERLEINKKPI